MSEPADQDVAGQADQHHVGPEGDRAGLVGDVVDQLAKREGGDETEFLLAHKEADDEAEEEGEDGAVGVGPGQEHDQQQLGEHHHVHEVAAQHEQAVDGLVGDGEDGGDDAFDYYSDG